MNAFIIINADNTIKIEIPTTQEFYKIVEDRLIREQVNFAVVDSAELPKPYNLVPVGSPVQYEKVFKQDWALKNGVPVLQDINDRYFRDCWVWDDSIKKVVVDPAKEKMQRAKNAREIRNELLKASDIDIAIAREQGNTTLENDLKNYRQALRDLGVAIDNDPVNISWPVKP